MKYNVAYQKLLMESVDSQWFSQYTDGMTASEWVEWSRKLNWFLAMQKVNRKLPTDYHDRP